MGLDMYLEKHTYVKNWDWMEPEARHEITIKGPKADEIKSERIHSIIEQVAYWRKANAIHAWFVENCADGVDNCQPAYVSKDQLQTLLDAVNKVLDNIRLIDGDVHNGTRFTAKDGREEMYEPGKVIENPEVAHRLLPSQSGFFFGGTDYDQYYVHNLEKTRDVLTEVLAEPGDADFYYSASW